MDRNIYSQPSLSPGVVFYRAVKNTPWANRKPQLPRVIQGSVPGRLWSLYFHQSVGIFLCVWLKHTLLSRYCDSLTLMSQPTALERMSRPSRSNTLIFSVRHSAGFLPSDTAFGAMVGSHLKQQSRQQKANKTAKTWPQKRPVFIVWETKYRHTVASSNLNWECTCQVTSIFIALSMTTNSS